MFGIIAKPLGWLMTQIYGLVGNYGLTLIIITFVVKMCLYPLYKKQILSTAGMTDMQPKMQELQRKYANDKETLNQKMAELYKEEGFNPMSGCLPMIVQMIIIMGLFGLLRTPMLYMSDVSMYFAVHESFLWIKDLSQPDLWILPIITGVATFFATWMSQQAGSASGSNQVMMNIMKYFFPIMLVWLARSYAAGLAIYWAAGQVMQIFFNLRFNQLKKAMKEKKKPAKKKKK